MNLVDPLTAAAQANYPSVSLLVPLDGETPWEARLEALRIDAVARLRSEFGPDLDQHLLDKLRSTVTGAQAPVGAASVAVYVNAIDACVVGLTVPVRERAVIDDTFATRDLVAGGLRRPRYWVLALNLRKPALFHSRNGRLHARPLRLTGITEDPSTRRNGRNTDRRTSNEIQRTRRLRAIDNALSTAIAGSSEPIVVVGVDPTLPQFLARTRNVERIGAVVRRAPGTDVAALAEAVGPAVKEMLADRRDHALEDLGRAVDSGTASSGIEPVWRSVRRSGRGLLLVENDFEQPARITANRDLVPVDDPTAPGVVDDMVDDIIETVLAAGGRVELVPNGALAEHQRIAFVPWERRRGR